jgi:hypothetical protein
MTGVSAAASNAELLRNVVKSAIAMLALHLGKGKLKKTARENSSSQSRHRPSYD